MDIARIGSALVRRWYVVALGVLIALGVGTLAYFSSSAAYQTTAKVTLVPPNLSTEQQPSNPLLELNNNLAQTASVMVDVLGADTLQQVVSATAGGTYTVSNIELRSQVFTSTLTVSATGRSANQAQATAQKVINELGSQLLGIQQRAGVADSSKLIRTEVTVPPSPGDVANSGGTRAAAGAAVAVLGVAMLLALGLDALRRRRSDSDGEKVPVKKSKDHPSLASSGD